MSATYYVVCETQKNILYSVPCSSLQKAKNLAKSIAQTEGVKVNILDPLRAWTTVAEYDENGNKVELNECV